MDKKVKQILKYILSALLALLMLWISFRGVDWKDFAEGLSSCRWGYVVLSMVLGVIAFWIRGLRWRQLIIPIDSSITRTTAFNAVNIGYLANFIFPRIGEFARCGVISRNCSKASYEKVLGTVVMERAWDMLSMIFLLVVLLTAGWSRFGGFFVEQIWTPAASRFNISMWWIVAIVAVVFAVTLFCIWKCRDTNKLCMKIWGLSVGLGQGLTSCLRMERKWMFLIYTALIWASYWLMAVSIMRAVPELDSLNLVDALFLSLAGSLGWVVPVPGGIGAFHFVVSLALSSIYALPMSQGIVFATLSHESQAITMLLFGGFSFLWESFRQKGER